MTKLDHKISKLDFQFIYPAEGNSAILEVCDEDCDQSNSDLMHVYATSEEEFEFRIFQHDRPLVISLEQMQEIIDTAKGNIEYFDADAYWSDRSEE